MSNEIGARKTVKRYHAFRSRHDDGTVCLDYGPPVDVEMIMHACGRWTKAPGESIYGVTRYCGHCGELLEEQT